MPKIAWTVLIVATSTAFLTGCAALGISDPAPVVVTPDPHSYSDAFQERMADELETLVGRQCPREWVTDRCSALWTFTIDSVEMRDRIRAAEGEES